MTTSYDHRVSNLRIRVARVPVSGTTMVAGPIARHLGSFRSFRHRSAPPFSPLTGTSGSIYLEGAPSQ